MDNYPEISEKQKQVFQKTNWGKMSAACAIMFQVSSLWLSPVTSSFSLPDIEKRRMYWKAPALDIGSLELYVLHDVLTVVIFGPHVPVYAHTHDMFLDMAESRHRHREP